MHLLSWSTLYKEMQEESLKSTELVIGGLRRAFSAPYGTFWYVVVNARNATYPVDDTYLVTQDCIHLVTFPTC